MILSNAQRIYFGYTNDVLIWHLEKSSRNTAVNLLYYKVIQKEDAMDINNQVTDLNTYRNQRRKNKNVRWVMIPVFLLVCLLAGYFFSMSGIFAVRHIDIIGTDAVTQEEILAVSGIELGMNIFSVNEDLAEELLPIIARVETAQVDKRLPGTIEVFITEREPVAIMSTGKAVVELDSTGRILDRYTTVSGDALPLITGVDITGQGLVAGCFIKGKGLQKALDILSAMPEDAEDIGEINVSDPEYIKLYTLNGPEVRLGGSEDFAEKYAIYSAIIKESQYEEGRALRYIDVSILSKPTLSYE